MDIDFQRILKSLGAYQPMLVQQSSSIEPYGDVRFLDERRLDLEKQVLYLGFVSCFRTMLSHPDFNKQQLAESGFLLIDDSKTHEPLTAEAIEPPGDIIVLPPETPQLRVYNDVMDLFRTLRKLGDSSAALLDTMIEGKGLNYIIQVGSEILGNPVFLVDASTKLLAASANTNVADAMWSELAAIGYGDTGKLAAYVHEGYVRQIEEGTLPVLMDIGLENNLKRIVGKIVVSRKTIGYIGVLEHQKELGPDDVKITGLLCDVVAAEMQKTKEYDNLSGVMHEYLLLDLLDERSHLNPQLQSRADMLFQSTRHHYQILVVNLQDGTFEKQALGYFRWTFDRQIPGCKTVFYADRIVLVLNSRDDAQLETTILNIRSILIRYGLQAGLSRTFHKLLDLRSYYLQARRAVELGPALIQEECLFTYDDLYIYDLLEQFHPLEMLRPYIEPGLTSLKEYDRRHGTTYDETLIVYLEAAGNITKTADRLQIHRNTAVHRIKRIEEVLKTDFSLGQTFFKFYLSYRILDLLGRDVKST